MPSNSFDDFCGQVCSVIRWEPARQAARRELLAHLEDHAAALEAKGVPPEEAAERAVEAMGDPYELGHQLDRCHSPLVPRLSRILAVFACVFFLFGFCIGVTRMTGLFRYEDFVLPAASLPLWPQETLLAGGSAQGQGKVGGYTIRANQAALIRTSGTASIPAHPEVQVSVTVSHWQPWLDNLYPYYIPAVWHDLTGGSGAVEIVTTSSTLLSSRWCLYLEEATPGRRRFSITLGKPGDQCILNVFLEEEVPSS